MQLRTCLSNCNPLLGKVLRSIAKGRRLAKVREKQGCNFRGLRKRCVVQGDVRGGAASPIPGEGSRGKTEPKKHRKWLLQSAGAGKQEKGTNDRSTKLQESESSLAERLARKKECDKRKGTSHHGPEPTTQQEAHKSSHCCTQPHLKNIAAFA